MKTCCYSLFLAIPVSLFFATSAHADEVSTKASDLIPLNNQLTTSKQQEFPIAQNIKTENSSQLPEKNYWYVSGGVNAGFPNKIRVTQGEDTASIGVDTAFQGNIAVGYQWDEARTELEVGYSSFGVKNFQSGDVTIPLSGSVSATTVLVNGYWDIPSGSKWRPYIGAGIGVAFPNFSELKSGDVTEPAVGGTALTVQGKAGIEYEIAKKGNVFLELKYQNIGSFTTGSGDDKSNISTTNSFGIGVGSRQGF